MKIFDSIKGKISKDHEPDVIGWIVPFQNLCFEALTNLIPQNVTLFENRIFGDNWVWIIRVLPHLIN